MTPGINATRRENIFYKVHEYTHSPSNTPYGEEAAIKMGVPPERVFKTLVVRLSEKQLAVGIVPVSSMLNMKRIAKATGAKKAEIATASDVERSTGYVLGGVSPLGQKRQLKTIIDVTAMQFSTIFVSAGRRGLEIELKPSDLGKLCNAIFADIGRSN